MKTKRIFGWIMVSISAAALYTLCGLCIGFVPATLIWGGTFALVGWISLSAYLLSD